MNATRSTFTILGLVLAGIGAGCGGGGGGGGGAGASIVPGASGGTAPVLSATRDPLGYRFDLFYQPTGAIGGEVTAMTVAPASTEILAGVEPLGLVARIDGQQAVNEGSFVFDVTSFATLGSQVYAGTSNAFAPRSVSVYVRDSATNSWMLSLDGTQREVAITTFAGAPWAFTGEVDGAEGTVAVLSSNRWTTIATIGSAVPQIACVHSSTIYVGSKAWSSQGGLAKLHRSTTGTTWEDIPVPGIVGPGSTARVSALASIAATSTQSYLFVGTETVDNLGAVTGGSIQYYDESLQGLVVLEQLSGESVRAMVQADGTLYVGTSKGRILWFDANQQFQEESGVPTNKGVTALAVDNGTLFAGAKTSSGAVILRRTGLSGALPPPPPPPPPVGGGPSIAMLSPNNGQIGATITITGAGFDATAANDTVKFNGTAATVTMASATSLTVTVPAGATSGQVTVTVAGKTSNGSMFTVVTPKTFLADVKPVLAAQQCASCHDQNHPTFKLGGTDQQNFNACVAQTTTPAETSRIVTKPTQDGVTHGGGTRFAKGSAEYNTILQWIKDGKKFQ